MKEPPFLRILLVSSSNVDVDIARALRDDGYDLEGTAIFPADNEALEGVAAVVVVADRHSDQDVIDWVATFSERVAIVVFFVDLDKDETNALLHAGAQDALSIDHVADRGALIIANAIERQKGRMRILEKFSNTKLRDSEALYHSLVESLSQNIIRKDLNGRFTFANSNFCKSVGIPIGELVGKTDADLFPPALAQKYQDDDRRVIESRTPFEIEEAYKNADRETLVVKVVKTPVFDAGGSVIGTQGIFWDITDQKRAEAELAASRERFEIAVRGTTDGIWDWDVQTNEVYYSERFKELIGYKPEEFGNDFDMWASHLHPDDREAVLQAVTDHIESRIAFDVEYRLRCKNGSYQWFRARGLAVWGASGRATRMAGSISDISARRAAEHALRARTLELERSNHDLEQFAYIASHDLKEPLRMVSSYVGLLERRYKESLDDEAQEFIRFAVDGAARMKILIDDLLVFSRVGTKGKELVDTDTSKALAAALSNLEVAIRETEAEITIDPDSLPNVIGDDVQLIQLFQNLVGNSIKFSKPGVSPKVKISAVKDPQNSQFWLFSVQDNGIGIDSAHSERIFEIFQRLNLRSDYPGTGIGLAVARKIVERHQGTIRVESAVGKGATFLFTLLRSDLERSKS
jgi:PAS domain S-box-containing protein